MVCVPCIVIPFMIWFFHRYLRPMVEKFFPSLLKYLPGNVQNQEITIEKCPFKKDDQNQSAETNQTQCKTEVTAGDGGTKKTN